MPLQIRNFALTTGFVGIGVALGVFVTPLLRHTAGQADEGASDKVAVERIVRSYILEHPEIIPEAIERLRQQDDRQQLSSVRGEIEKPFPGAVLGNPKGKVTLVQFTDYACTYCRQSLADVDAVIAGNPELRVVVRELPILGPESVSAARMAIAAAEQGKYALFHKAMFLAGPPDSLAIARAASAAGLDMKRAERVSSSPVVAAELQRNVQLAKQLKFSGTPSWVAGDEMLSGAVGQEKLEEAISRSAGRG